MGSTNETGSYSALAAPTQCIRSGHTCGSQIACKLLFINC